MANICVTHSDINFLQKITDDQSNPSFKKVIQKAVKVPKLIGKLYFYANYPQAATWPMEKRLAMKMSTVYLAAKDYLVESGIPIELLDIAALMFSVLKINL